MLNAVIILYLLLNINKIILQTESTVNLDLFTAAKQLADSEIELIKVIENSTKCQRTATNMLSNAKKTKKPGKSKNVNIIC